MFVTIILNSLFCKSLISVSLVFLETYLALLFGTYSPVSSFSLTLCVIHGIKQSFLPELTDCGLLEEMNPVNQPRLSSYLALKLLWLFKPPSFFSGSQYLRVFQDSSVSQRGGSKSAPSCWQTRSQTLGQQPEPLPGRNYNEGHFCLLPLHWA